MNTIIYLPHLSIMLRCASLIRMAIMQPYSGYQLIRQQKGPAGHSPPTADVSGPATTNTQWSPIRTNICQSYQDCPVRKTVTVFVGNWHRIAYAHPYISGNDNLVISEQKNAEFILIADANLLHIISFSVNFNNNYYIRKIIMLV